MGIVEEIIEACNTVLDSILTDYKPLDYMYLFGLNSERSIDKRYGFTSGPSVFAEGRAMGFTTMNHTFKLELSESFLNKDCDEALRTVLYNQYSLVQKTLKELQKSRLALPTAGNQVLLISGQAMDEPEVIEENSIVILRTNFNIQYKYKNN